MAGAVPRRREREEAIFLASTLSEAVRRLSLDVVARADQLLPGDGVARLGGGGVEVNGVREYHPGDEVRGIDWRVTARRGSLHVKVFAPEKDQAVLLVLDRSAALRGGRGGLKEIRALETTALLAAVAVKEGRRVGLIHPRGGGAELLAPRRGRHQFLLLLSRLLEGGAEVGAASLSTLLEAARHGIRERTRIFLVGDLTRGVGDPPAWETALQALAHRHAVTAIAVRDRLEGDFPSVGSILVREAGSGRAAVVRTRGLRSRRTPFGGDDGGAPIPDLLGAGVGTRVVEVQDPLLPQLRALLDGGGKGRRRGA